MIKEVKGKNLEIVYNESDDPESTLVDTVIIREMNDSSGLTSANEIYVNYKILHNEPYDSLIIQNKKSKYVIEIRIEKNENKEDPFFTYKCYYENKTAEEIANDIKKYIMTLITDALNLS